MRSSCLANTAGYSLQVFAFRMRLLSVMVQEMSRLVLREVGLLQNFVSIDKNSMIILFMYYYNNIILLVLSE